MAALTRRTWAQLQAETVKRLGNVDSTGTDGTTFATRVNYWLRAAHLDLSTTYHHFELDQTSPLTLSTSVNSVALPADCFIVVAARLKDAAGTTLLAQLTQKSFQALSDEYRATAAQPEFYARYGPNLYVNCLPSSAFKVDLFYYRLPAAPDFAGSGSPETGEDLDEHLMEGACRKAFPGLGRADLGDVGRQLLSEFLAMQPRPSVLDEQLPNLQERVQSPRTYGGAQG
jgi:hypothetical protein